MFLPKMSLPVWNPARVGSTRIQEEEEEVAPCAQRRKVWLAPTARLPCSNAANGRAQNLEDAK